MFVFYKLSQRRINVSSSKLDEVISLSSSSIFVLILFFLAYGPNVIFAKLVTPQIRAWNRLTPVIILLVMVFGFAIGKKIFQYYRSQILTKVGLLPKIQGILPIILIAVVLLDQAPARGSARGIIDQGILRTQLAKEYVSKLDKGLTKNCLVLELPITPFPENPPIVKLPDYELMFPALIDTKLRWSYGAMKNTPAASIYTTFQTMNTKQLIIEAKKSGYCAIHYDSRGYPNNQVLQALTQYLGTPFVRGFQNQWYAFKLTSITN
jgi:phosphoglycerol transferase